MRVLFTTATPPAHAHIQLPAAPAPGAAGHAVDLLERLAVERQPILSA